MFEWVGTLHDRTRRGWRLSKRAFRILQEEKQFLVFPLLSSIALVLVLLSFAVPLLTSELFRDVANQQNVNPLTANVLYYLVLFAFYFCNYFVIVFFNSALVTCIVLHFEGEKPTVSDGFQAAFSRLPQILLWAMISATVGVILRIIVEQSKTLGKIVAGMMGMTWGIMTFFVVPVLVVEKAGPFKAISRSAHIMTKTWGGAVLANFSISLIMTVLSLVAAAPFVLGLFIGGWAALIGLVITLTLWMILSLVSSVMQTIIMAALYLYATEKRAPRGFKEGSLANAFGKT